MKIFVLTLFCFANIIAAAQNVNASINSGNEFYKLSQFDKAEAAYRQALQQDPNNATAQYNLANALHKQKKYDEAIAVLERLNAAAADKHAAVNYNEGVAHSKQKSLEKSVEAYKQSLKVNPNDVQVRENLQKALRELKQKQQEQQQKQKQSGGGGGMSQKEAEQQLKMLQEKEKKLQQKLQSRQGPKGAAGSKDW